MRTTWHSLVWKEWHEHKWKLVSLLAIMWATTSLAMQVETDRLGLAFGVLMLCVAPLSVFVGLGAAANERSRDTLPFLQSLPVPMWRVAFVKLVMGLATLAAAVALATASFYVWRLLFDLLGIGLHVSARSLEKGSPIANTGSWYIDAAIFCSAIAASLFIWTAAAGVNRKDEVRAAAVALSVMVSLYGLLAIGFHFALDADTPESRGGWLVILGLSTLPGGFIRAADLSRGNGPWFAASMIVAATVHVALATWYICRFGRISDTANRSPQVAVGSVERPEWLASPRYSPLTAIAWKQFRESAPLAMVGLAAAAGIVMLFVVPNPSRFYTGPNSFSEVTASVVTSLGYGVALVLGIGVCLNDLAPQVNTFWRSRPTNPDLWFWSKFVTGLVILMGSLYLPLIAVVLLTHSDPERIFAHKNAIIMPLLHMAIFAAAVATTCLVRHAIYAAILSIAGMYLCVLFGLGMQLLVGLLQGKLAFDHHTWWGPTEAQTAVAFLFSFGICTIVAWLAMRNDWGWKSRY